MHIPTPIRRVTLPIGALLLIAACSGGAQAGWTYAPLGPEREPVRGRFRRPFLWDASSGTPSSPSGSGGAGTAVNIETTSDQPLAFNPAISPSPPARRSP